MPFRRRSRKPKGKAGEFPLPRLECPKKQEFAERLFHEVLAWPENRSSRTQADDITIVVIDIAGLRSVS